MQYLQQNEGWKTADINGFDGQEVNLCTLSPGETPINIEVADGTVSSVQRGGPGINQRGIKDCPMCYRSPLVLDFLFSVIALCFHQASVIQLHFPGTVSNYQHLSGAQQIMFYSPLELGFCYVLLLSPTLLTKSWGSVWKSKERGFQLCASETISHI